MSVSLSASSRVHRFSTSAYSVAGPEEKGEHVMGGYLHKKGKLNSAYQNRYFVLYANNTLSYYQNATAIHDKPLGEISLYNVTNIKEEGEEEFHVITAKRTYSLKCTDKDELEQWLKQIKLRVNPNIVCESWLFKKGEKNKQWKLRYFVLCEYEMCYQVRYYEDEARTKFKGCINCDFIDDVKILPNTSVQKYGKDKVLELVTEHRVYVIAGEDAKSRNLWYKSFKKVLFGEDVDKEREKEKYKQQQIEQEREALKLFDSLNQSQKVQQEEKHAEHPTTTPSPTPPTKENIVAQPSIFVETKPKSKSPAPSTATTATSSTDTVAVSNTKTNPFTKSFEPFVEKHVHKVPAPANKKKQEDLLFMDLIGGTNEQMKAIDDEQEVERKRVTNGDDNQHIDSNMENGKGDDMQSTLGQSSNPFFVDQNQSMQTVNAHTNGANVLHSSLDTVSTVNDSKHSTLEHPLQSSMSKTVATRTNPFMQDSMMSNVSASNGYDNVYDEANGQDRDTTKDSAVFSKKFIETDYESPNYQLIQDNDLDMFDQEAKSQKHCCAKCVIL